MSRMKFFAVVCVTLILSMSSVRAAEVSARRALNNVLPKIELDNVSVSDAIDFLRDVSGANIHVNWKALEEVGVGKDAQVNVRLRAVSLRKVMDLVLGEAGAGTALTYYIDQGVIEVTTREIADKQLFTKVYPIQDLIVEIPDFAGPNLNIASNNSGSSGGSGGGSSGGNSILGNSGSSAERDEKSMTRTERAEQLIDVIINTIQPDIWQTNGGTAAIRFFNGSLVVTAPRSVHEALGGNVD